MAAERQKREIETTCPCCGARLRIDTSLGQVISHESAARHALDRELTNPLQFLEQEKARREVLFEKSAEDEKSKSQLLERKFEEALKKTRNEPITRPTREIDLD